jgi:hypothetical protein
MYKCFYAAPTEPEYLWVDGFYKHGAPTEQSFTTYPGLGL